MGFLHVLAELGSYSLDDAAYLCRQYGEYVCLV